MIGMLRAMQLHDEALEHGYEKYMEYILEPSGVTLEELQGASGRGKRTCDHSACI